MTSVDLASLVRINQLKLEPPTEGEVENLQRSGETRLADATNPSLSLESRFDLAYSGAHALARAALRRLGYRPQSRYIVFQVLPHTLGLPPAIWRVLAKGHETRNLAEYEGCLDIDEGLVADIVDAATRVQAALRAAGPA